ARPISSHDNVGAIAHAIDASVNTTSPIKNTRRLPKKSPAPPPSRISAPSGSRYALIVHASSVAPAPRSCPSAGRAPWTPEPSMNARLDPRIVAASVARGCRVTDGCAAAAILTSHGVANAVLIGWQARWIERFRAEGLQVTALAGEHAADFFSAIHPK